MPPDCLTFVYKHDVNNQPIHVDIYPPLSTPARSDTSACPAVVYFHGGSLTVGNRQSWFPSWLHSAFHACQFTPYHGSFEVGLWAYLNSHLERVTASGMAFISADYTLLVPATGHDILHDVNDLFRFLELEANKQTREVCEKEKCPSFEINPSALAVAGSSAGSMCVYYAALYASPKPKVALSLYGMGGDMLVSLCPSVHIIAFSFRQDVDLPCAQNLPLPPRTRDLRSSGLCGVSVSRL